MLQAGGRAISRLWPPAAVDVCRVWTDGEVLVSIFWDVFCCMLVYEEDCCCCR